MEHVESCGGRIILMASRALAASAESRDDYLAVYGRLIAQAKDKVILHWLGEMFDPQLAGYWGSPDVDQAMATVLSLIERHAAQASTASRSRCWSRRHEERMRKLLPHGVKMYTGDDFNYAALIAGDGQTHLPRPARHLRSDRACGGGGLRQAGRRRPRRLPRHPRRRPCRCRAQIFEAPTQYYKAGVVFMAWLNGFQDHFRMLGGMESARGVLHYAEVFRLADASGLLRDPDLAASRMKALMAVNGVS